MKTGKMKTGLKIAIGVVSAVAVGTGGYFLYKYINKEKDKVTEKQFARLVAVAQNPSNSIDIFDGLSTTKLDEIYIKIGEKLNSEEVERLIALFSKQRTPNEKKEVDVIMTKWMGKIRG